MTELERNIILDAVRRCDAGNLVKGCTLMVRPKLPAASPVQAKYVELSGHSDVIEGVVAFGRRLNRELCHSNRVQITYFDTPGHDRFGDFRIIVRPKRFTTEGGEQ